MASTAAPARSPSGRLPARAGRPPVAPRSVPDPQAHGPLARAVARQLARPLVGALALVAVYVALSFANDPRGTLGTDTGGKVASLGAMDARGGASVDVGYWAAEADPTGALHPLYYTTSVDGQWINVTTLPMIEAAAPLYRVGGYRLALALPMLGAVGCALAARSLARRFGGTARAATLAFWVTGLASPVLVYALDVWEHTLGLAAMAWAVVALVGAAGAPERRGLVVRVGAAGTLFGLAATMRTEALLYGLVATGLWGLALLVAPEGSPALRRRGLVARLGALSAAGLAALAGLATVLVANDALERWIVGAPLRAGRAAGTAAGAADGIGTRLGEGLSTTFATGAATDQTGPVVLGVVLAAAVVVAVLADSPSRRRLRAGALALAGFVVVSAVASGPGFVPGLVAAAPLAAAGVAGVAGRGAPGVRPLAVAGATGALVLVWGFQFTGGALPQWGGRYVLLSTFVLLVAGCVEVERRSRAVAVTLVALSVLVTLSGAWWLHERSHAFGAAGAALAARPEPVLVSTEAHLFREIGGVAQARHWLTAENRAELDEAFAIADRAGADEVGLVQIGGVAPAATLGGRRAVHTDTIPLFAGEPIVVTTYRR